MKMAAYHRLVKELIEDGFDTTPTLQIALSRYGVLFRRVIAPKARGRQRTHGPALQQALRYLSHNRKIRYDKVRCRWEVQKHLTYFPPASVTWLLEQHSKTIPTHIERSILLL